MRLHRAKAVDTAADAPGETPPEPQSDRIMLSQHEQPDNGNIVRIAVEDAQPPAVVAKLATKASIDEKPSRVVLASGNAATGTSTQPTVVEPRKSTASTPTRWLLNLGSLLKIR